MIDVYLSHSTFLLVQVKINFQKGFIRRFLNYAIQMFDQICRDKYSDKKLLGGRGRSQLNYGN